MKKKTGKVSVIEYCNLIQKDSRFQSLVNKRNRKLLKLSNKKGK